MSNDLLKARLVWDGGDEVRIPPEMGTPRADQMQGTVPEQLSELAGRICYDSLGKGRPSFGWQAYDADNGPRVIEGYHDHILAVGHGSVLEHYNFTVEIPIGASRKLSNDVPYVDSRQALLAWQCANRPGVITLSMSRPRGATSPRTLRVTLNMRSVIEWLSWCREFYGRITPLDIQLASMFHRVAHKLAPHIIPSSPAVDGEISGQMWSASLVEYDELDMAELAAPISDHEKWISLYLSGSRGFSHEQVRHGDFTAISQRSTRYVDESESPWVEHPLITAYRNRCIDGDDDDFTYDSLVYLSQRIRDCEGTSKRLYDFWAMRLEGWLISRGIDKTSARKQARGAARGYLGNALQTEMIFSASVAQWKRMIRQRCSPFADAEIREVYTHVVRELKSSRYGDSFAAFELEPSPDGIGMVAVEKRKQPATV